MIKTKTAATRPNYGKKFLAAFHPDQIILPLMTFATSYIAIKIIPAIYYMEKVPLLRDLASDLRAEDRDKITRLIEGIVPSDLIQRAWAMSAADLAMMIGPFLLMMLLIRFATQYIYNDIAVDENKGPTLAITYAWVLDAVGHVIDRYVFYVPIIFVFFPSLLEVLL